MISGNKVSKPKQEENILNFWENLGNSKSPGKLVTHKDFNQVSIEINTILNLLNEKDKVLDVGCGNGFSTSIYSKKCLKVVGVDYSSNMIDSAKKAHKKKNLSFELGNVLSLNYKIGSFSVIVSTRCLINLPNWNDQKRAIHNMHKMLDKGGRLILVEGINQGRDKLNKLRVKMGLSSMPNVWHNLDFDEDKLFPLLKKLFIINRDIRFGLYDVLTRVNYPACIHPEEPKYGTNWHATAEKLYYSLGNNLWNEYSREVCLELIRK